MTVSLVEPGEIERVTECITQALAADPVWSVALARDDGRTDHLASYWRIIVEGAMLCGGVHQWNSGEAYSVWVPPGPSDLSPELEEASQTWGSRWLSKEGAVALDELYEHMEGFYDDVPTVHAYLDLLATHQDHRGRGVGQTLLAADIAEWDALGIPTCLESSNQANNHRYLRAGYQSVGSYSAVLNDARVTKMLRLVPGSVEP
jgi:GNAT superfamily N-acetyltransferase